MMKPKVKRQLTLEEKKDYKRKVNLIAFDRFQVARGLVERDYLHRHPLSSRAKDGICSCGNPVNYFEELPLMMGSSGESWNIHKHCKSWACPVCAPKRAYARAGEIETALVQGNELGYQMLFLTFTVPHKKRHSTSYVIDRLSASYNKFLQRKPVRDFKEKYGFVGQIKCLDYTLTENGTHAHYHCIWFFDCDDMTDLLISAGQTIPLYYDKVVYRECGKHISFKHGFNIEPIDASSHALASYASKAISVYVSDGDKEKEGSLHPFNLLDRGSTEEQHEQYLDFYHGQKGRRHIVFSRGLKQLLADRVRELRDSLPALPSVRRAGLTETPDYHLADASKLSFIVANIDYEHAYFLRDLRNRYIFDDLFSKDTVSALAWLDDETKKQQEQLRRDWCYADALHPSDCSDIAVYGNTVALNQLERGYSLTRVSWLEGCLRARVAYDLETCKFRPQMKRKKKTLKKMTFDDFVRQRYKLLLDNRDRDRKDLQAQLRASAGPSGYTSDLSMKLAHDIVGLPSNDELLKTAEEQVKKEEESGVLQYHGMSGLGRAFAMAGITVGSYNPPPVEETRAKHRYNPGAVELLKQHMREGSARTYRQYKIKHGEDGKENWGSVAPYYPPSGSNLMCGGSVSTEELDEGDVFGF